MLRISPHGTPIPPRVFVVTFDDGYENTYHYAWPVLKEFGIPATVFVATAYLDQVEPFPFDDWSAAGAEDVPRVCWQPLSTDQCREMIEDGLVEVGSHTHTHADFHNEPEKLRRKLQESLVVLRRGSACRKLRSHFRSGLQARISPSRRKRPACCAA